MKTNALKKAVTLLFSAMLVISMAVPVMAADDGLNPGADEGYADNWQQSVTHDKVQDVSSDVATILVGKTLSVNQDDKFPIVKNFEYELTPVEVFLNANTNTASTGSLYSDQDVDKTNLNTNAPDPTIAGNSGNPHASGSVNNTAGSADNIEKTRIHVGDFTTGAKSGNSYPAGNTYPTGYTNVTINNGTQNSMDTGAIEAAGSGRTRGSVSEENSATRRTRYNPVDIKFDKAGYYLYELHEVNSEAYDSIPGMFYDDHNYYVAIYVANKTDANGNTIDGVYVHDVTIWRNESANAGNGTKSDYKPHLTDIAWEVDIKNALGSKNAAAAQDNNRGNSQEQYGENPAVQNGSTDNDVETNARNSAKTESADGKVTSKEGNLAKVGIGTNIVDPRFWNDQITRDVILSKDVTGNLGDRSKKFEFEVTMGNLEKGQTYTINVEADGTEQDWRAHTSSVATDKPQNLGKTTTGVKIEALTSGGAGTVAADGLSFTATDTGTAKFLVKLSDDQRIVFNSLPVSSTYQVTERSSDHVASYTLDQVQTGKNDIGDNGAAEQYTAWNVNATTGAPNAGETRIVDKTNFNTAQKTALATETEKVDLTEGTVEVQFTNERNMATVTGLGNAFYPLAVSAIVLVIALAVFSRRRRSSGLDEL